MATLLQFSAALYLAGGIAGGLALALGDRRAGRVGVACLAAGALAHGIGFLALHRVTPTPQLTELPVAVSLMAWMVVVSFLVFARRGRLAALAVVVGPVAFLGAFLAALRIPADGRAAAPMGAGSWPHLHVLLASAGLALLAVAAIAGAVFLVENRRLKRHRARAGGSGPRLPSLETLDRLNAVALAVGFPLLTLGVVTGMVWLHGAEGVAWRGSAHEAWNAIAWTIYAVLVAARFAAHQAGRAAAASAVAGFVFLLFAVVGVGTLG